MATTTSLRRAFLEDAWELTQASYPAVLPEDLDGQFRVQLRLEVTTARKLIAGGSLSEIEANRRRTIFADQGVGQLTPLEAVELWQALVDLYDRTRTRLEEDDDAVTDQEVFDEMMEDLPSACEPITETTSDWSLARC